MGWGKVSQSTPLKSCSKRVDCAGLQVAESLEHLVHDARRLPFYRYPLAILFDMVEGILHGARWPKTLSLPPSISYIVWCGRKDSSFHCKGWGMPLQKQCNFHNKVLCHKWRCGMLQHISDVLVHGLIHYKVTVLVPKFLKHASHISMHWREITMVGWNPCLLSLEAWSTRAARGARKSVGKNLDDVQWA